MAKSSRVFGRPGDRLRPLTAISVEGFKSIDEEQSIEIRPLTILAGVNSSGKSSMLQPLLLLKQTLEAPYDPGPLLLNGPNAKFTKVDQLLCKSRAGRAEYFAFGLSVGSQNRYSFRFKRGIDSPVVLESVTMNLGGQQSELREGVSDLSASPVSKMFPRGFLGTNVGGRVRVTRNRCFLEGSIGVEKDNDEHELKVGFGNSMFEDAIAYMIHVPGLRGNPRRNYPLTAVGDRFPGTFEDYAASVIASHKDDTPGFLSQLGSDLRELSLTWKVSVKSVDDTQVELLVGRLSEATRGGAHDLVSIADVGFGVSQTLPVVTALLAAKPGQLVYIEQPEIHLHPRAQHAMAKLLARAAKRGVQVVVETHSSLLLLGLQSCVAENNLDPLLVKLHWFRCDESTGATRVVSADLDRAGSFGDWPEDFDDISLSAQQRYLDAAEKKILS